jgi:uncharacterized membrane protein YuzA (DUF378 family)
MRTLNVITLILIIIGGLNWGLFGLANIDLVAAIFGGPNSTIAKAVYVIVGLSALYQLYPWSLSLSDGEVAAESGRYTDANWRG